MKNETSPEASACPLCGAVFEHAESGALAWSDFCQRRICTQCAMEMPMEFYNRESRHFAAAARLLETDIWECRKRYLADSITKTREQLDHEVERVIIGFLNTSLIRCAARIEAIERFLELREKGASIEVLAEEERALEETLFGTGETG